MNTFIDTVDRAFANLDQCKKLSKTYPHQLTQIISETGGICIMLVGWLGWCLVCTVLALIKPSIIQIRLPNTTVFKYGKHCLPKRQINGAQHPLLSG